MKVPGCVVRAPDSATHWSPFAYGSGRSSTPLTTVKIAVAEPMPTANATTASRATPGVDLPGGSLSEISPEHRR
jgi:hypothetical protein